MNSAKSTVGFLLVRRDTLRRVGGDIGRPGNSVEEAKILAHDEVLDTVPVLSTERRVGETVRGNTATLGGRLKAFSLFSSSERLESKFFAEVLRYVEEVKRWPVP